MKYRMLVHLKEAVRKVMEENPQTRNDDILLTTEVWRKYFSECLVGNGELVRISDLFMLPREDSVKRMRAFWQNERGILLPTRWEIAKRRQITQDEFLVALGYPTASTAGTEKPEWTPPSERRRSSIKDTRKNLYLNLSL